MVEFCPAIVPDWIWIGGDDRHRGVGLEHQHPSIRRKSEINSAIVKRQSGCNFSKSRHGDGSQNARHVLQEFFFLRATPRVFGHGGAEIMDLPVSRDGKMDWIKIPVDRHHTIFSPKSISAARIQIFDRQHVSFSQFRSCGMQQAAIRHANEILSSMKARRAQQQRKRQVCIRHEIGQMLLNDPWGHNARQFREPQGVRLAAGQAY